MIPTVLAVALATAPAAAQQGDFLRAVPAPQSITIDPAHHRSDLLVVKFREGSGVRARDGALQGLAVDLDPVRRAIADRPVRARFAGLEAELADLRRRIDQRIPPGRARPADLRLYVEIATRGHADSRVVLDALLRCAVVETANPASQPVPPPGDVPPTTPNFSVQQGYRAPAPSGIDALAIEQLTGAWGSGLTLTDIEWGWRFDHEDLSQLRGDALLGPPSSSSSFDDHGLAVIGEIAGDPDAWGISGLIPDIHVRVATAFPSSGYSVAQAIVRALPRMQAQDVLLLEVQANTPLGFGPAEWVQEDFDAIQNATALGIITVEAAGNGGIDLDSPRLGGRFDLSVRDSGALIVGATSGPNLTRSGSSCFGSRIDANGWGASVTTSGYGDLFSAGGDPRQTYTTGFNGTSSASPMVAAAVVAIIGSARAQLDPTAAAAIDHLTLRDLLRNHGTQLQAGQRIGRRPDVTKLLTAAGTLRGLRRLDTARLGNPTSIELAAPFGAAAGDAWILFASAGTANLPIALPGATPACARLLVDPVSLLALPGAFSGPTQTFTFGVPNRPALTLGRLYLQALTVQAASGASCLSNSSMIYVLP
ncbi:MAG: S8 family serine peptidase [Planctomycetota bacterium]